MTSSIDTAVQGGVTSLTAGSCSTREWRRELEREWNAALGQFHVVIQGEDQTGAQVGEERQPTVDRATAREDSALATSDKTLPATKMGSEVVAHAQTSVAHEVAPSVNRTNGMALGFASFRTQDREARTSGALSTLREPLPPPNRDEQRQSVHVAVHESGGEVSVLMRVSGHEALAKSALSEALQAHPARLRSVRINGVLVHERGQEPQESESDRRY